MRGARVWDYFPKGDPILANEDELTTDGDYPPTPQSGPDFTMDEQLAYFG